MTIEVGRLAAAARSSHWWLAALVALGLAACEGDTMKDGPAGPPGPGGPSGPPAGTDNPAPVGSAKEIVAQITAVTVPDDGRPVVDVYLVNEDGRPLGGLPADGIRFVLSRLEPAVNGKSSAWRAVTRRTESFPGTPPPTPPNRVTGTASTNQGYTEAATAGTWTDNGDGTFRYRFLKSLTTDSEIPFDASLVHRVGLEIRTSPSVAPTNIPANNAVFTFRPPGGSDLEQSGREIVDNDTCNACHDNLSIHGDARFDLQYCVMCHEAYSFDAQSGNSIDLKVMIHKIHSSETLPSVEAGGFYGIFGFGNTFNDFSDLPYPHLQDLRNCQTCHEEGDTDTPQASNWRLTVNREACGSCHDDVNFDTGAGHGGNAATDDMCSACHGPSSSLGVRADQMHVVPALEAAKKFQYELVSVTNTAPNQLPAVTVKVVDPTNNNAPYDLLDTTDPANPFRQPSSRLRVQLAWQSVEFNNTGLVWTGTPGQPLTVTLINNGVPTAGLTPNTGGSFTLVSTVPIPAAAAGSGMASVEGKPYVVLTGSGEGEDDTTPDVVPVDSVSKAFAITDTTAVTRRTVVDINKCNDCHKPLAIHGDARVNNTLLCSSCHNPSMVANATLGNADPANAEGTVDLKHMVHALHNGSFATKTDDYGFNQGSEYPGRLNNCEGCHLANTYYPLDPATTQGSSMLAGTDRNSFDDDVAMTPTVSVCAACHVGNVIEANRAEAAGQPVLDATAAHMLSEGGSFNAGKNAAGLVDTAVENCEVCHGQGRSVDVKLEHKVGEFNSN